MTRDFGDITIEHDGVTLSCKAIAPGIALHDLIKAFEKAKNEAQPGDELSADPSKWPLVRGIQAVADTLLAAMENDTNEQLLNVCKKYIEDQAITCPETIYQMDNVIESAYEFIEDVCDIVGYSDFDNEEE